LAPEGTILECNPRALEMYGASSRDQLIGIDAFSVLVPDDVGLGRRLIEQALREGIARGAELTVRRRDGSEFVGQFAMGAIPDGSGKPAQIVAIVDDVTDRRRMEDALRASERNYREIFNATNEAIFVHDARTGKVLDVNQSMLAMYGCDYDGALRCDVSDLSLGMPPYSAAEAREWIDRAAREGPQLFEWLCRRCDGQAFWAEVNLKGAMIGGHRRILAVVRDISDRKQAETEAQQHLAELTRAWHANTMGEMASGLAHELNQPLCAIVNYTNGCLRMTKRPGASVELLRSPMKQVAEQAERAANIIKHIRGLVARRGRDRSPLDLNEVLLSALDMVRLEADRQGVTIDTQLATDLPPIPADAVEIEQVAMNLMRNAIEAMSVPEATNRILTLGTSQTKDGQIAIWVSDTGPGFPSDLAEKLFNSFYTTKRDGLGIGLSLSRRIIEAYGGRLWAESDGRTGATFRCILPI
jgi:PAS domain S-box-containing protein